MLRRTLLYSCKSQYSGMIFDIIRTSHQHNQISYLSNLSLKTICCVTRNLQLVSNSVKCIVQLNSRCSSAVISNKSEKLSESVLFENSELCEEEKDKEVKRIVTFLKSKEYTSKEIKEKFSPYIKSVDCSYTKIALLYDIDSDILLLMPLLLLPLTILRLAAKQARRDKSFLKNFPSRIHYLSHNLELKYNELIPAVTKHSALLTMQFKRLDHKMSILKSANISSEYIVKDLWIFNYNERLLASRVQSAVNAGMELKPWMLRCSEKFFESMLKKFSETQRILDGESVTSYLAKKLNCGEDYIDYMMERNKVLKSVNIPKLEQVSNFLFERGYTPQEVRLFPRVFCSSVQTLSKRFEEFKRVKSTLPTISQLCISSKNFENSLKRTSH